MGLNYFIGVDISKDKLDVAVRNKEKVLWHEVIANDQTQIREFIQRLKKIEKFSLRKALFCAENSGYYVNHLLHVLNKVKGNIHLGDPLHMKNSMGTIREKSDRLDAIRLATFAYRNREELRLWKPRREAVVRLAALNTVRTRIMTIAGMIRVPLKDQRGFVDRDVHNDVVKCCTKSLVALTDDLNLLEKALLELLRSDVKLSRYYDIICSVPYVGPVTAIQIIVATNEFLEITCPRKFASYAGVAPFKRESGQTTGKTQGKISKAASRKMKTLLHICAVGTIRRKGEFRNYYERRCSEGKPPMVIVNAIRNKIIRRIFSCIKHDRLYLSAEELSRQTDQLTVIEEKVPRRKRYKFAQRTLGNALS